MNRLIIAITFFVVLSSCGRNIKRDPIEGKWRSLDTTKGCEIIFKNGFYSLTRWSDDLVNASKGKYFFNKNQARQNTTVTLVPDLQYSEGDTIILPCENIDVMSITDSILTTQKPTQWIHKVGGGTTKENLTEVYKKIEE